jgi:hypothetical protein
MAIPFSPWSDPSMRLAWVVLVIFTSSVRASAAGHWSDRHHPTHQESVIFAGEALYVIGLRLLQLFHHAITGGFLLFS